MRIKLVGLVFNKENDYILMHSKCRNDGSHYFDVVRTEINGFGFERTCLEFHLEDEGIRYQEVKPLAQLTLEPIGVTNFIYKVDTNTSINSDDLFLSSQYGDNLYWVNIASLDEPAFKERLGYNGDVAFFIRQALCI